MIKVLLKKQLLEISQSFIKSKDGKSRSQVTSILLLLLFAVILFGTFGILFSGLALMLCEPLVQAGLGWSYFVYFSLIASLVGVIGNVFMTYNSLYRAKDNDLLLSLPIPVGNILVVRLLGVYLVGLLFCAFVFLPAVIVYWITVSFRFATVCGGVLLLLCLSVFVLVLSCLLGWLVAKISRKLKHKSLVTVVFSLLFIGVYYFFYFKVSDYLQLLFSKAEQIGSAVKRFAFPLYLLGRAGEGDALSLLVTVLVHAALLALTVFLLSRSFLHLATSSGAAAGSAYRADRSVKCRGMDRALLSREFRRFWGSANYMLNCGMGTIFMILAGGAALVKGEFLRDLLSSDALPIPGIGLVMFCGALCMLASMNTISAPSVSLEGNTLWLLQSLPVPPRQALFAKLELHFLLSEPPLLFCALCLIFALRPAWTEIVLLLLLPTVFCFFSACFGLWLNLRHPNLTWKNEVTPIKQSLSVFLAMFSGMIFGLLFILGYVFVGLKIGAVLWSVLFLLLAALLAFLLFRWIDRKGSRVFAAL